MWIDDIEDIDVFRLTSYIKNKTLLNLLCILASHTDYLCTTIHSWIYDNKRVKDILTIIGLSNISIIRYIYHKYNKVYTESNFLYDIKCLYNKFRYFLEKKRDKSVDELVAQKYNPWTSCYICDKCIPVSDKDIHEAFECNVHLSCLECNKMVEIINVDKPLCNECLSNLDDDMIFH